MSAISELSRLRTRGGGPKDAPRDTMVALGFLAPWILGLLLITIVPIAASAYLSFTKYDLFSAPRWIGIDNFVRMASDPRLLASLKVTFTYVLIGVPLSMAAALAVAMALDKGLRGLSFYRSMFYLPSLLGSSVAVAILWKQIFGVNGLVNAFLGLFGAEPRGWISDPETALWTLILLSVWGFGAPMVIFLAGLRQIPAMYYEAASVDGAGPIRKFFSITLPLLSPIIFFNLVLSTIGAFQTFTQAFIISGGAGGPSDSTLFYSLYLYQRGFAAFDMGYASAMAWLLVAIIAAFTAINFLLSKFWVFYND